MKTRLTEMLGIRFPVLCPGMTHVSSAPLVAAVGEAGGLGILALGHLSPDAARREIRRVRELTSAPFGVGVALIMPGAEQNAQIAIEERVPVLNFSLGKGDCLTRAVHDYGGKVLATVVNRKHALAAERAGADGLLVTGHEAAAHGGEVTSLVLVQSIRAVTKLPIVAVGGFATGRSLVAALSLGADGVAMGTRFLATAESPAHASTLEAIVARDEAATIYTSNFDSMPCRIMDTPHARELSKTRLSPARALRLALKAARQLGRSTAEIAVDVGRLGPKGALELAYFGAATLAIEKAIVEGDLEHGVQLIGQCQGHIVDVPNVAELMARLEAEAREALYELRAIDA